MGLTKKSMSTQTTTLCAQPREKMGKGPSYRLRVKGDIPAIVYGKKMNPVMVSVNEKTLDGILKTKLGANTLIDLAIDGKNHHQVLVKDYQADAFTRKLKHVDFFVVDANQEVLVAIPVHFSGKAAGLTKGGILEVKLHEMELYATVGKIPEEIVVDITSLDVGDNIHLKDITLPAGVRAREGYNPTIVIMTTITEEEIAAATAPAVAPAADAAAPGAAPAEGAAAAPAAAGAAPGAAAAAPKAGAAPKKEGK